jgi:tRNA uridine 5-carboxymethylaminomethyl modification enzyme
MFTSRAEHRILLRQDNADLRLTRLSAAIGLADEHRIEALNNKQNQIQQLTRRLSEFKLDPVQDNYRIESSGNAPIKERIPATTLLRRPQVNMNTLKGLSPKLNEIISAYPQEVLQQLEIDVKYEPYIEREHKLVEKIHSLEDHNIWPDLNYDLIKALSAEGREKLKKHKPRTIGQASRISGVSPSDISILSVYLGQ